MRKRKEIFGYLCAAAVAACWARVPGLDAVASPTDAVVSPTDAGASSGPPAPRAAPAVPPVVTASPAAVLAPADAPVTPSAPSTAPAAGDDAGVSLIASQVDVGDTGRLEMHVRDAELLDVLRILSMKMRRNIVASKGVEGRVTANLYNVTFADAMDAILQSNGYVYREKGNFTYVYSAKELSELDKTSRGTSTEVFHLYYTPAANAATMIKPVLSTEAQVAVTTAAQSGIELSGGGDTGGNSHAAEDMITVTDYAENLEKARRVLQEVDHRPQEILVEATILAATLTDNNSLGVDFSVMGGVDFGQFLSTPTATISSAAGGNLQNASGAGVGNYGIGQTSFTNNLPPGGLRVGFLTNNVSVFVQALESVTNTVVLANPKVLSLDKQKGYVHIGRSDGYQTTTVTQTTSTQTVQFLDSGTTLAFRPFIGTDGYVRLEVHPEDSSGGLTSTNLPFKTTTEVTANLMVKDGHTIVIGGLFRDTSTTSRSQVPLLGNIPLLGVLFRQRQDQSQRQEIIVLLTPHIIKDESAYARVSAEDRKHAEDLRVGVRKGMMFFGRERLAEQAYEDAVAEQNKPRPDRDLVLWHLDAATNLNPTFSEAIELKEQVSGRRVTDADNSSIRSFVSRAVLADTAPPPPSPAATLIDGGKPTTRPPGARVE